MEYKFREGDGGAAELELPGRGGRRPGVGGWWVAVQTAGVGGAPSHGDEAEMVHKVENETVVLGLRITRARRHFDAPAGGCGGQRR